MKFLFQVEYLKTKNQGHIDIAYVIVNATSFQAGAKAARKAVKEKRNAFAVSGRHGGDTLRTTKEDLVEVDQVVGSNSISRKNFVDKQK